MSPKIEREIANLPRLSVKQLRRRYEELHGETTKTGNKTWLIKRIAWRIQALEEGDLSERARKRAADLANEADLRLNPPRQRAPVPAAPERTVVLDAPRPSDDRLPPPGSILTRKYKDQTLQVKVLANGFEYQGEVFASLSAVAKAITGSHCNGFLFFRLHKESK